MTRDELIETMARAIFAAEGQTHADDARMFQAVKWEELDDDDYQCVRSGYRSQASSALTAIEAAGYAVVPREPTDRQLLAMETGSSLATVYELALAHSPFKGTK